jgi:hypothetical protein
MSSLHERRIEVHFDKKEIWLRTVHTDYNTFVDEYDPCWTLLSPQEASELADELNDACDAVARHASTKK